MSKDKNIETHKNNKRKDKKRKSKRKNKSKKKTLEYFYCGICFQFFHFLVHLRNHQKKHKNLHYKEKCDFCKKKIPRKNKKRH